MTGFGFFNDLLITFDDSFHFPLSHSQIAGQCQCFIRGMGVIPKGGLSVHVTNAHSPPCQFETCCPRPRQGELPWCIKQ